MKLHLEIDPDDPRDVEAGERTLRRLRESVGVPVAPPLPARRRKQRGPTRVVPPTPDELAKVSPIDQARTAAMAERKGMVKP